MVGLDNIYLNYLNPCQDVCTGYGKEPMTSLLQTAASMILRASS